MVITRYKELFSVSVSLKKGVSEITEDILVKPVNLSEALFRDLRLVSKSSGNSCTIYFEGTEQTVNGEPGCVPVVNTVSNDYFYFTVSFRNSSSFSGWKFHSDNAAASATGFPVLYDAKVTAAGPPAVVSFAAREDVKIQSPVFAFTGELPLSGIAGELVSLEIRDETNQLVDLGVNPVQLKESESPGADRKFSFSIDATALAPGVYRFKTGSYEKKFFFATRMNPDGAALLVRVLKNEFLKYVTKLSEKNFIQFTLQLPQI